MKKLLTMCLMLLGVVAQAQNFAITATTEAAIRKNIVKGNASNYGLGVINDTLKLIGLTTRNVIFTGTIGKSGLGLGLVDNTSDANKPVSTATQTQLNLKQNQLNGTGFVKASGTTISYDNSTYLLTSSAASTYLPISNPTATGTLTAPNISNSLGANFATTSGNVGVGTTSPSAKLTVSGGSLAVSGNGINFASELTTGRTGTFDNSSLSSIHTYFDNKSIEFSAGSTNGFVAGISATAGNGTLFGGNIRFITASTDRMRIFANGRVGINTITDAGYLLDVNGTLRTVNDAYFATTSGNVAIGKNSAFTKLDVYDGTLTGTTPLTNNILRLSSNGNLAAATINFTDGIAYNAFIGMQAGNIHFAAGSANPQVTLLTNGQLGIGTTSPSNLLHIKGTATQGIGVRNSHLIIESAETAGVDVGAVLKFGGQSGNAVNPYSFATIEAKKESAVANNYCSYLSFHLIQADGGSIERIRISSSGNVGIGTTTPTSKLQILGMSVYDTNAAAVAGGLTTGAFYRTTAGVVMCVL